MGVVNGGVSILIPMDGGLWTVRVGAFGTRGVTGGITGGDERVEKDGVDEDKVLVFGVAEDVSVDVVVRLRLSFIFRPVDEEGVCEGSDDDRVREP